MATTLPLSNQVRADEEANAEAWSHAEATFDSGHVGDSEPVPVEASAEACSTVGLGRRSASCGPLLSHRLGGDRGPGLVLGRPGLPLYALARASATAGLGCWYEEPTLLEHHDHQYEADRCTLPAQRPWLRPWSRRRPPRDR